MAAESAVHLLHLEEVIMATTQTQLFAIDDGHAGNEAVTVAKEILPHLWEDFLGHRDSFIPCMSIVDCLQDAQDVEGARAADEEVTTQLVDNKLTPHMETSSGTVACLGSVKGADMWIANLGDCRNVLSNDGTALAISGDYAPEENAAEAEQFADLRSSCFRDCMSKFRVATLTLRSTWPYREPSGTCVSAEAHVAEGCRYSHSSKFEGISSEPEAFSAKIDGAVDFVIIGTDGIWDALKEQLGLTHARKALRTAAKPEDAAAAILQSAGKVSTWLCSSFLSCSRSGLGCQEFP